MSFIKAIDSGKEHRKHYIQYLNRGWWDGSCTCHSAKQYQCPWCRDNRLHSTKVREEAAKDQLLAIMR